MTTIFELDRIHLMNSSSLPTTRYLRSHSVVFRKIADEALLVPIARTSADMHAIYTLNAVGASIWDQLDGHNSLDTICDRLVREFAVEQAVAQIDLLEFLQQLVEVGAVEEIVQ